MPRVRVKRTRRFRFTDSVVIDDAVDHLDANIRAYTVDSPVDVSKLEHESELYETDDIEDLDPTVTVKTLSEHVVELLRAGTFDEADALIFKHNLDMGQMYFLAGHYSEMEGRA